MSSTDFTLPTNWAVMPSVKIGSSTRNTSEPGGSVLKISFDDASTLSIDDPLVMDFIDFSLPALKANAYSTVLLAAKKWQTMGVSRLIDSDQISGTIECPMETYEKLSGLIGSKGTARIEVPTQGRFCQWRIALLSVDGPQIKDGDRMTGNITLTVTNTAPDDQSEMAPVFGSYTPTATTVAGPTLTPAS